MAEEIKELIEKIQQEGIQVAENKARQIEAEAREQAEEILTKVRQEAARIISEAKEKSTKTEEAGRSTLKQIARDTLLNLKKEINALLERIIRLKTKEALSVEELAKFIAMLIKDYTAKDKGEIIISLKKEDWEKLEKGFLAELKDKVKAGVRLTVLEDISSGFTISYDSGKSHFDFTEEALAEYLSGFVKPKLAELLKDKDILS